MITLDSLTNCHFCCKVNSSVMAAWNLGTQLSLEEVKQYCVNRLVKVT
ncbi:hypothetical protein [Nostoc sp.]